MNSDLHGIFIAVLLLAAVSFAMAQGCAGMPSS